MTPSCLVISQSGGLGDSLFRLLVLLMAKAIALLLSSNPEKIAELKKQMPEIAARYNARVLPPDTFDSLMSREERDLVKSANGE